MDGYENPKHFEHDLIWNRDVGRIELKFSFKSSIEATTLTVTLLNKEKFKSLSGKHLENEQNTIKFSGFTVLNSITTNTVDTLQGANKFGTRGIFALTIGVYSLSSICSNALAFLSKLIQIIEFSGLMEYFNIDFDENLGIFLHELNEATSFQLLNLPRNEWTESIENSVAAPFKGKLSKVELPPYFLEDAGYPGLFMIVSHPLTLHQLVYLIHLVQSLRGKEIGTRFLMFRISLFYALLIDYSAISLRTLGHFTLETTHLTLDYLSYLLAAFVMNCFAYDLYYMYSVVNRPSFYLKIEHKTGKDKALKEVFFEGLNIDSVKTCWFVRNYNLFYLMRFMGICWIIFNLQYLQILQVVGALIVMTTFSAMTFYYHFKFRIFSSKFVTFFKLCQEASMTIIVIIINIFCYDSFKHVLTNRQKVILIISFVCLLALNIVLEISSSIVNLCSLIKSSCRKKNKKTKKVKKISVSPVASSNTSLEQNPKKAKNSRRKKTIRISEYSKNIKSAKMFKNRRGKIVANSETGLNAPIHKKFPNFHPIGKLGRLGYKPFGRTVSSSRKLWPSQMMGRIIGKSKSVKKVKFVK